MIIGAKYCGGCNPTIDREKLVQEIKTLLPQEFILADNNPHDPWDVGILVCGCLTACAHKPDFKSPVQQWIVVAGNSVDCNAISEQQLAKTVLRKLKL